MDIQTITVPKGIRYITEWPGYSLENYPFPHILDKVLTGCGFTEYCLRNQQNLVLCSPRKMLLENKQEQHPGEVFYAKNEVLDSVDFDRVFSESEGKKRLHQIWFKKKDPIIEKKLQEERRQKVLKLKEQIKAYCRNCILAGIPAKIIVTYDSFRHVKEALEELGILLDFQIVIDEFQSILVDAKFKSTTELELLYHLRDLQRICFASATPMMEKYLNRLEEFNQLPYYQFDWITEDPGRIINPNLGIHKTENVIKDAVKIVEDYKAGNFAVESWIDDQGMIQEIKSTEAVFYVNSVKAICSIIRKCMLTPENSNILCAKTTENEKKVRDAFNEVLRKLYPSDKTKRCRGDIIGSIPKRGELHKMFTFCTRTVYLGADFYSECAMTFIFSDSNIDCLSVDIGLDLPQILGRQRLDINPWKNCAELYVKSTILELTKEDFDRELERKKSITKNLLISYDYSPTSETKHDLANKYEKDAISSAYKDDYVAVNHHAGSDSLPVFNNLMQVADERTFDIQQIDYKDRVSVFNTLKEKGFVTIDVEKELNTFNLIPFYHDKMRYLCLLGEQLDSIHFDLFLNSIPKEFKNYYNVLGPGGCSACSFKKSEMKKEYDKRVLNQNIDLENEIYKEFKVGDRILKSEVKEKLGKIYNQIGYQASPKATDLGEWFNLKAYQETNKETGKRDHGFEIISKK